MRRIRLGRHSTHRFTYASAVILQILQDTPLREQTVSELHTPVAIAQINVQIKPV